MTRAEAKRLVCRTAATLISNDADFWFGEDERGNDLTDADCARVRAARDELVAELRRRSVNGGGS